MSKHESDIVTQFIQNPITVPAIDIAVNAGYLYATGKIGVDDSRALVETIKETAIVFHTEFDADDENRDYMAEVDDYADKTLKKHHGRPLHEVLADDYSLKFTPWTGETLSVLFKDGRRTEICTAPGCAMQCWNEEFSVMADQIQEAYISDDDEMTENWLRGGPGEVYPNEQVRIINGYHVYIGGTWYEVSGGGDGVLYHGNCDEGMTPRQVYNHYYPRLENDGKSFSNVTLFFIDNLSEKILHITEKTVKLDVFCYNSELAEEWRHCIPKGNDRRIEGYMLHVEPSPPNRRPLVWPSRPRILMAEGAHITLPPEVLFHQIAPTYSVPRHLTATGKLDAIASYLTEAGIKWQNM